MALEINFENNFRGALVQVQDSLSGADLVEAIDQVFKLDGRNKLEYQILDFSNGFHIDFDTPTIRYLAHLCQSMANKNGSFRLAIVGEAPKIKQLYDSLIGFARNPNLHIESCRDMGTARSWISQADLEIMV